MSELSYETADVNGYIPDFNLLGVCLKHSGNDNVYRVTGFCWLGETDEWGFTHVRVDRGPVVFCRPMSHLDGARKDGTPRYERVNASVA